MLNRVSLEKEIKEYCYLNQINDINGFISQCMLKGFNVFRYGMSPSDNINIEKGQMSIDDDSQHMKTSNTEGIKKPKKKTIKVIRND